MQSSGNLKRASQLRTLCRCIVPQSVNEYLYGEPKKPEKRENSQEKWTLMYTSEQVLINYLLWDALQVQNLLNEIELDR